MASERASAVSGRRRSFQRREPEKVSGAGQFSAGSNFPPFELELRYAAGEGRVLHALDFDLFEPSLGYLSLPRSSFFFIPPRLPAATHSRLLSLHTSQSSLLRSALLSGLSFAALNFFRPPSALRLRPHSAPAPARRVTSRRSLSRLIGRFCAQPFLGAAAAGCTGNYYRSTSP